MNTDRRKYFRGQIGAGHPFVDFTYGGIGMDGTGNGGQFHIAPFISCCMGELVSAVHIPCCIDVLVAGAQPAVHLDTGPLHCDGGIGSGPWETPGYLVS